MGSDYRFYAEHREAEGDWVWLTWGNFGEHGAAGAGFSDDSRASAKAVWHVDRSEVIGGCEAFEAFWSTHWPDEEDAIWQKALESFGGEPVIPLHARDIPELLAFLPEMSPLKEDWARLSARLDQDRVRLLLTFC